MHALTVVVIGTWLRRQHIQVQRAAPGRLRAGSPFTHRGETIVVRIGMTVSGRGRSSTKRALHLRRFHARARERATTR